MAANIPAKLKTAGITPFVIRAAQLETAKPVIAYWCHYWIVNQILAKQLHNADDECLEFTTMLMDKLEHMKTTHADNDAILDDVAGQAYVEQFAQETFERALRPLKANKVTQQTAVTFEAAATFFQLINIWGTPEAEVQEKIKFAKWNAARILKAIKEGKDPNESNPQQEEAKEEPAEPLDPNDPDVRAISTGLPRPPMVEDAPDGGEPSEAPASSYSLHATGPVSAPTSPLPPTAPVPDQVSPIAPPDVPSQEPGSYFPNAPSAVDQSPLDLPSTTSMPPPGSGVVGSPPVNSTPSSYAPGIPPSVPSRPPGAPSTPPQDYYNPPPQPQHLNAPTPTPPFVSPQQHFQQQQPQAPPPAQNYYQPPPAQPVVPRVMPAPGVMPARTAVPVPVQQHGSSTTTSNVDDMAMAQAQKHAKWAISALNFEDVPTAIKELQAALATLGAR